MSRSGYTEDCGDYDDDNRSLLWRGAVQSAMRGKRGQAFLTELLAAMDALPARRLVAGDFEAPETGMPFASRRDVCALGALDPSVDEYDAEYLADRFGIARALAAEIVYQNDECVSDHRYVEIDICGPVRPMYPDWGRQTKTITVADPHAGARRWERVRAWVAKQIKEPA